MKDLNVTANGNEITILEGKAPEIFNPEKIEINGILDSPFRFLEKRVSEIEQKKCIIIVDRDRMSITLIVDEKSHFSDSISGKMELHPDFVKFGINAGKYRTAFEMAEFIKMNKAFFANRSEAADLVVQLRKFKAKVDKQVEAEFNPNKGDKKAVLQQAVDTNLPPTFKVNIPIFKGTPKRELELETYFNPDDLTCTLVCAEVNEIIQDYKDASIDEQLDAIKEVAPDIVIIEV